MLPKINRIAKQKDFDRFFGSAFKRARGRSASTPALILKALPGATDQNRVAFVISNKVDNRAVVRNKLRRRLREALRGQLNKLTLKADLLFIAQKPLTQTDFAGSKNLVISLLKKTNLL